VKAANPDGSENKGESRWHIFADDKIILTATVNELTNGKTDTLYDSVANKAFGKKMLSILRSNDLSKATEILKGAQPAPAPAAPAPAPMGEPAAPEMDMGEPRDAGGTGDPKEELPELLTTAENTLADIRAAVEALLEEGEAGLEGFDELSEGMGAEAKAVVGLNKLSKKVGKAMLVGMKSAEHELSEQINELKMASHVVNNRGKVRADQVEYVDGLVADAVADTKKVLQSCLGLMSTFVKYADGTKDVEKRADTVKKAQLGEEEWTRGGPGKPPFSPGSVAGPGSAPAKRYESGADVPPPPPMPDAGSGKRQAPPEPTGSLFDDPEVMKALKEMEAAGVTGERAMSEEEFAESGGGASYTDDQDLKVGPEGITITPGDKLEADDKDDKDDKDEKEEDDLGTKEARAKAREKMAAQALKWHPLLNEAHPGGGETTQLDTKPTGDLAKVERLDETNKAMLDVATAPPRVRQAAEEIQRLVAIGKIDPEGKTAPGFDELIAEGLDKDAVAYWKQYWGQAKAEGSQFASELVKEHTAKKKAEEEEAYRVKVARAYDLAHEMVRRGMLADDRTTVNAQVNELLALSDKGFDSYKRFTEKQAVTKQASMPQVGMLTGEPSVVVAGPPAAPTDIAAELNAAFANLPLKGRLF
jgi:hypothetical protein